MRTLFYDLLLLGLFSNVFSDCQKDCLTCREKLHPSRDSFNVDECISHCEGGDLPGAVWGPCAKAVNRGPWHLGAAGQAAAAFYQPRAMEAMEAPPSDGQAEAKNRVSRIRSLFRGPEPEAAASFGEAGEEMQKKLQKRFGGFTGARKSARKLANQKRFSEFMRQYLVMSMHASERQRHGLAPGRTLRQNVSV
ncbi:prepronociceptin [Antechinus flavipes]|uniref:prepronociceptin n=1 Tax=Antechinus flavipes TaxID=38775 RepID=UPI00223655D1|nr:prepronociceptin [Antechinus flavipes]